jgi:NADPH:quinone reductase-like Zn-dependent oxidoreductase
MYNEMKAVLTTGHGGLEQLVYTSVPTPRPGAGEVLIRVAACGVNNTEIWAREGKYGTEDEPDAISVASRKEGSFPMIQGADLVGTVVAVGEGVPRQRMGERVIVDFVIHTDDGPSGIGYLGGIGSRRSGGYAEYCAVPARNAFAVDSNWTDMELATLPCAYTTAANMLAQVRLAEGSLVAVTGAAGGVGSALLQLANLRGLRVVALTRSQKRDQIEDLKPFAVVETDGDVRAQIEATAGIHRLDAAFDVVGGRLVTHLLNGLRPLGTYVVSGAAAGAVVSIDLRTVYLKHLRIVGASMGTRESFREVLEAATQNRIRPLLARVFPLSEIRAAHQFFIDGQYFGKIVVAP